ncbi:transporter [Actinomadura meridiana]|uniref:Transporter n=1 Tax=Actinomadura meridiana TaxID=559626 RepID=A0ABP8CNG8_9ACTN
MIWLTLRQFRVQAAVLLGGLVALGAFLVLTRQGLVDDYGNGLAECGSVDNCGKFTRNFFDDHQTSFGAMIAVVVFVPGIIGVFWGAPLITREIEHNTHRLVWNQSITRTRWLAVKLGVIGLVAAVTAGLSALVVDWWSDPIDKAAIKDAPRLAPLVFDARGIVPISYAAFAFALGVTVGVVVRRTLPTMAITLAVFVAVQIVTPMFIRSHLIPPKTATVAITEQNHGEMMMNGDRETMKLALKVDVEPGAWTLTNETVDRSGKKVGEITIPATSPCRPHPPEPGGPGSPMVEPEGPSKACFDYLAAQGFRQKVVYHPANRFWPLQWAETGLFAIVTLGLTGFCFYWTRRRLT